MAGYYYHEGTDPDTYVIYLRGGGACYDEATCKKRAKSALGSSIYWAATQPGAGVYSADCSRNPDFCNASHVYVPYCTGDEHSGNNTSPSDTTWGLYFDGHANLAAIVDELVREHGLGKAKRVLLSGASAGGVGTFKNVDWLAERLPSATVKGSPNAGWFFPAALPDDLPDVYPPSDWAHFSAGTHGNGDVNGTIPTFVSAHLWQSSGLLPAACVADQKPGEWWACASVDKQYKYIKSPLYVVENQYDSDQIFAQELVPRAPSSAAESAMVASYITMYGEAMRNSTAQVLNDAPVAKKSQPDGLFHPSCLSHAIISTVNGQSWLPILGDWFFERNKLQQFYRLVEHCPAAAGGMPCGTNPQCIFNPAPGPSPGPSSGLAPSGACAAQLKADGCLPALSASQCLKCAAAHETDLRAVGCKTTEQVKNFCGQLLMV